MPGYKYLIVGGGMSAAAAIKGIREVDADGSIGLISAESDPPYKRPPLSKKLWQGKPLEIVWKGMPQAGGDHLDMHLGTTVAEVRPGERRVVDQAGNEYAYEKLLLATGGAPRRLPFGGDRIIYFRSLDDFRRLKALVGTRQRFAVIGGGFIGTEVAAALAANGKDVTLITPEQGIGERLYPAGLVRYLSDYYAQHGVELLMGEKVVGLDESGLEGEALDLQLESGRVVRADAVIAGIGLEPNTSLAYEAGLAVGNGVVVDEYLRTSDPHIYAAGDVAFYRDCTLGTRRRVEHEDNANSMGRVAGRAMAGAVEPYDHLPFFYSDLFDLGYEAVGEVDSRLEIVEDWKEPYREGVVYYLREGRVRGVLLWNVWGQVNAARALISEPGPFQAADLMGRLPDRSATT